MRSGSFSIPHLRVQVQPSLTGILMAEAEGHRQQAQIHLIRALTLEEAERGAEATRVFELMNAELAATIMCQQQATMQLLAHVLLRIDALEKRQQPRFGT